VDIDEIKKFLLIAQDHADQVLACYLNPIKWVPAVFNFLEKNRVAKLTTGYWATIDWIAAQSIKKWGNKDPEKDFSTTTMEEEDSRNSGKPYEAYAEILVKL